MYNSSKCNEVEEAYEFWIFVAILLCTEWSVPQFQENEIECMIMIFVSTEADDASLPSAYLPFYARLSCMSN